jgi:glycosyltransferase involved in cell wall biosynthesis
MKKNIKILITSPSINTDENVSGIANLTRLLIEKNKIIDYELFVVGKKDKEPRDLAWLVKQPLVLFAFIRKILNTEISLIHINIPLQKYSTIINSLLALICKLFNKPYLIHIRGGLYSNNKCIPNLHKFLFNNSLKYARSIITLGNEETIFINEFYKIPHSKIYTLPNSVQIPDIDVLKNKNNNLLQLLYMGRIDKDKGLTEIIQALKHFSIGNLFNLNIAGDGPDKVWFLNNLSIENINFTYHGVVNGNDKSKLLSIAHIFLLPSYYEGLPNSLLEAMSYGVIPIVTPVGSISEVVKDKFNGYLVPVKSSVDIVKALTLINNNVIVSNSMSLNAFNSIQKNYCLNNYIIRLNEIYMNLCQ